MLLLRDLNLTDTLRGGALSIGNFDGVHRGHQEIAARLVRMARRLGGPAVVLTFDPPPAALLRPERVPPRLSSIETRAHWLAGCGVDAVVAYPTDRALLELTPAEFFDSIVRNRIQARGLVEGPNFCFGKGRAGTIDTLRDLCAVSNLEFEVVPALAHDGGMISSTEVRRLLDAGDVAGAARIMGHGHRVAGRVVKGAERGHTLGFPTANLEQLDALLPPDGVYAGVTSLHGRVWPVAMNIGPNPTFGEGAKKVEAHVVDFTGDLYGQHLAVDLLARLRETVRFASVDALRQQLAKDIAGAVEIARSSRVTT